MSEKTKKPAATSDAETEVSREGRKPAFGRVLVAATAKEGRRRADIDFSQSGTVIEFEEISQDQWELILADPLLTIRPAKDEPSQGV